MKRTYQTGLGDNSINCSVVVGTTGIAYSSILNKRSGGQQTKLAESSLSSGTIKEKEIGKASTLNKSYLIITTYIDFSAFDKKQWNDLKNTLTIQYKISGGFSGTQLYNQDLDDIQSFFDGKILVITKPIELL